MRTRHVISDRASRQHRQEKGRAPRPRKRSCFPAYLALGCVLAFASPFAWHHYGDDAAALARSLIGASPAAAQELSGRATVVDGDTLAIEGVEPRIRLYGIDTPESQQTCNDGSGQRYLCGSRAAGALASIIGRSGRVQCFEEDRDRYGRIVAECVTPDNVVINAAMVEAGWALEYDDYSDGRYEQEEAEAREAARGLWQGEFVPPWDWRQGARLASETSAADRECPIKGNISDSGRIYHRPGQRYYSRTKIDESAGERWFCSPSEAEAAGWRAARR